MSTARGIAPHILASQGSISRRSPDTVLHKGLLLIRTLPTRAVRLHMLSESQTARIVLDTAI